MEVEQEIVNYHGMQGEFDVNVTEEGNAELRLSSLVKELEDDKDRLKDVYNKKRELEVGRKRGRLKPHEMKIGVKETRSEEQDGFLNDEKDSREMLGLTL